MRERRLLSLPAGGLAVVVGAHGAIGAALLRELQARGRFAAVIGFSRKSQVASSVASPFMAVMDVCLESSVAEASRRIADTGLPLRLVINATGFLHGDGYKPEKSWCAIDPEHMAKSFAVNAIGAALLVKHFVPLLALEGKAVFATLSAKLGSIGDNHLGGWYSYRASKAALNQIIHTAAVELGRRKRESLCVALHPGTVMSPMSNPFRMEGLAVCAPEIAAERLLTVVDRLRKVDNGGFFDYEGRSLSW